MADDPPLLLDLRGLDVELQDTDDGPACHITDGSDNVRIGCGPRGVDAEAIRRLDLLRWALDDYAERLHRQVGSIPPVAHDVTGAARQPEPGS